MQRNANQPSFTSLQPAQKWSNASPSPTFAAMLRKSSGPPGYVLIRSYQIEKNPAVLREADGDFRLQPLFIDLPQMHSPNCSSCSSQCLELFATVWVLAWDCFGLFGTVWVRVWNCLGDCLGQFGIVLETFGTVWVSLGTNQPTNQSTNPRPSQHHPKPFQNHPPTKPQPLTLCKYECVFFVFVPDFLKHKP